jgi:hypothetical protein
MGRHDLLKWRASKPTGRLMDRRAEATKDDFFLDNNSTAPAVF